MPPRCSDRPPSSARRRHRRDRGERCPVGDGEGRSGSRPGSPAGRSRCAGQPVIANGDGDVRPGGDVLAGVGRLGAGLRLPLLRHVRAGAHVRPARGARGRRGARLRGRTWRSSLRSVHAAEHAPAMESAAGAEREGSRRPRNGGPWRACGHVDGRDGPRHAQPLSRRGRAVGPDPAVVTDRPGGARLRLRRRSDCATTCSR